MTYTHRPDDLSTSPALPERLCPQCGRMVVWKICITDGEALGCAGWRLPYTPASGVSPTSHPTFCRDTPAKEG
jgi:hypothetical protein